MILTLVNWMRYCGTHTIELRKGAHGVVAEWDGDPRRSNWGGKSSALEAIAFVLWGTHRFDTEDEWITRGEKLGAVGLTIGPWSVRRQRTRGDRTQLFVDGDGQKADSAEAQELVATRVVGLDRENWERTCWLKQKSHSGLVTMRPADRMARVREWCDLAVLERAHEDARRRLRNIDKSIAEDKANFDAAIRAVTRATEQTGITEWDEVRVSDLLTAVSAEVREAEDRKKELNVAVKEHAKAAAERFAVIEKQNRAKRYRLEALSIRDRHSPPDPVVHGQLVTKLDNARQTKADADKAHKAAASLCRGEFDGHCPVNGKTCPIRAEIAADQDASLENLTKAQAAKKLADSEFTLVDRSFQGVDRSMRESHSFQVRAGELVRLAEDLEKEVGDKPMLPASGTAVDVDSELRDVQTRLSVLYEKRGTLKVALETGRRESERAASLNESMVEAYEERRKLRLACEVLGRSGAQRALAEDTVADVQDQANAALSSAEIPLSVKLEWGKATQRLEPECPACGETHPSTSKAQKCRSCGADRPHCRSDGLEVELSDRSGAAEDLAGLALTLAAGSVVRSRTHSPWSLVMVDEAFASLDEANSEHLSKQLGRLLGGSFGFERSLIVAHSRKVTDSLPNKIVVMAGPLGSSLRAE